MRRFIWFIGFLIGCPPALLQAQIIHYVSPDGGGDGSSWAQTSSLADAVASASSNDQLWLREGVYEIDEMVEFSYSHSGIHVYGGFDGTEANLDQRNVENNETIWDGLGERRILRIGADDIMLDGLTLRNGFVDGDNDGGGAVYISASGTTIQHCTFRDNIGAGGRGSGAIYYRNGNGLLIEHCLFENNRTQTYTADANGGGAIFSWASDMVIRHTVFRNNASHNDGGAIYSWDSMTLSDCVFEDNQSDRIGGAVKVHTMSTAVIRHVVFSNNHADEAGGAICVGSSAEATIINSLFDGNTAGNVAGAIYNTAGLKITNATFVNNQQHAIVFRSFSSDDYFTYIYNSIFYGNTSPEGTSPDISPLIDSYTSVDVELRRNILQADPLPLYSAAGNLVGADPLLVDPANADYRLLPASPAIDAGRAMLFNAVSTTNAGASTDLGGNPRLQGANIDMGAYEAEPPEIPECTVVSAPVGGATDVPLDAEITWAVVEDATGYRVTIGTTTGGTDVVDGQEVTGTAFVLPGGFAESTTYYVTVVPYNAAGDATDCTEISFTTETLPVTPGCTTITSPADGATDIALGADITWEAVDDATGYRITIGTTSGGTDVVDGQEVTGMAFSLPDGFAENTTYYVTVVPYNAAGDATDCTEISFTTETLLVPPNCATVTGPADGATDVPLDAEITWEAVEGATGYRITIGTTPGGTDVVDGQEITGTAFVLPGGFAESTTYYVTVVPYNAAGDATECAEISFTTETLPVPPGCVTINGPEDGAADVALDAEITWDAVEDATGYRITIGTEPGDADVIDGQEVTGTAFSLPDGFAENTTYYVTVVPYNAAGDATDCTEISFTTETLPVTPGCTTITSPADGATDIALGAEITWEAVDDATGYRISIGTTSGGTEVVDRQEVTGTAFSLSDGFVENTTYHVTVVPYNSAGAAADCAEISFTTETLPVPPDCTTITSPADGATGVPLDADITWEAVDDATSYRITIGTTSGGTDVVDGQEVTGTAFSLSDGFAENTTYYVTVVPYNAAGDATDCAEISFTTETLPVPPGCATITGPEDGATDVALDVEITWDAVEDATGYRISIGTTSGGTDVIDGQEVDGTAFSLSDGFAESTTYYVTVVPYNATGDASDCAEISFTTETLPVPPGCTTITDPVDGATDVALDVEITWDAVEDATGYRVTIGTTPGGTDVVGGQEVTGTVFSLPDGFAENTTYHVTVVPYNAAGEASDCTANSFTTETLPVPPVCATITGPADGGTDVALDAEITWEAVDDAMGYRITIGMEPGGTDVVDGQEVTGTAFVLPDGFLENITYYVTVLPYNAAEDATDCAEISFTTETLPVPPSCTTVTGPVDGDTDVALDAEITWEAVGDATGYRITIGTSAGGTDLIDGQEVIGTAFVLPDGFAENTTYYVTVVPYNGAGDATGCSAASFTTETLPVPPGCAIITNPVDGANSTALDEGITWTAVEGADGYRISIGITPAGTELVDNEEVTGTRFVPAVDFAENTAYYISVIPFNSAGAAMGCGYTRFVIIPDENIDRTKYGISPNGDGINDFWKIEGIGNYPDNTVSIYNRWGDMVFQLAHYDNVSKVFTGEANRLTRLGGGALPSGTYFFVIQYRDHEGQKKVEGFLVLRR